MIFIKELEREATPIPDSYSYGYVDHNGHEIKCDSWRANRMYFYQTTVDDCRFPVRRITKLDYLFYYVSAKNDNLLLSARIKEGK